MISLLVASASQTVPPNLLSEIEVQRRKKVDLRLANSLTTAAQEAEEKAAMLQSKEVHWAAKKAYEVCETCRTKFHPPDSVFCRRCGQKRPDPPKQENSSPPPLKNLTE